MKRCIFYIILIFCLISCNRNGVNTKNKLIARAYDKNLYLEDVLAKIPHYTTGQDSVIFIRNYIDKWVKDQCMLKKAELNIDENKISIDQDIENYRTKMYIFHYQQQYLKIELDTIVDDNEINEYHNSYLKDYKLTHNIVKAIYIKLPKSSGEKENIRRLYISNKESDINQLEELCKRENATYNNFNNNWISFNKILSIVPPARISNKERFLSRETTIEESDSLFYYFVNLNDFRIYDDDAPVSYLKQRIIDLIINKRKKRLLQQNQNDIYDKALRQNMIELFYN